MINVTEFKRKVIDEALNGQLLGKQLTYENKEFIKIANIYTGESTNDEEKKKYSVKIDDCYPYVATKDISMDSKVNYENGMYIPKNISKFNVAPANAILLCIEGGNAGNKIAVLDQQVCFVNKLCCFDVFGADNRFIYYYLLSNQFRNNFKSQMTGLIGGVSVKKIKSLLIPLPKIEEQKRIVAKLDEIFAELDKIDADQNKLVSLQDKLEDKLLQLAIQGKLVEQRSEEGTGEELFKQIQAEKQELIKQGKIKKEKPLAEITDDEIPFEIPSTWKWVRLGELGNYKKGPFGSALTKSMFVPKSDKSVKVYEQKNAIQKDWKLGSYYITKDYYESDMKSFSLLPNDIIVSCAGTIGETYVIPQEAELGIINQALMRMRIFSGVNQEYFLIYFDSILKGSANDKGKGTAIKNIPPFDILKSMLVPLPPYEEQKRIVAKLNELLPQVKSF